MLHRVLLATFFTAMISVVGALFMWPDGLVWGWFALFALFSAWNFWGLATFVARAISAGWSRGAGVKTFLSAQLRLFFTGFLVYATVVWWNAPVIALLGGLSVSLFWAALFGLFGAGTTKS